MSASRQRILIVEDEPIIAMDLCDTISSLGYIVTDTVSSGEKALQLCRLSPPDLVLMDLHLRGKMTGLEAAEILFQTQDIPSVVLTAYSEENHRKLQNTGVFGYLVKPYNERELDGTISMALHRSAELREMKLSLRRLTGLAQPVVSDRGCDVPLLEIRALGFPLELQLNGLTCTSEKMSKTQRDMLALLLIAPQCKVDHEELETELWPESSQDNARTSFDTTLSRLRSLVKTHLQLSQVKQYFSIRNGIFSLENYALDLHRFHEFDVRAREAKKRGDVSTAVACMEEACRLWGGEFLGGTSRHERVLEIRRHNLRVFLDNCLALAEYYDKENRPGAAETLLGRCLAVEPTDERIVSTLYLLLRKQDRRGEGGQLLRHYEKALAKDGIQGREVSESIRRIELQALLAEHARR